MQFTVVNPPASGNDNADVLIWKYGNRYKEVVNGTTSGKWYSEIEEMVVGETYTMSCWVRITSGTKARVVLRVDPYNGHYLTKYPERKELKIDVDANNGEWQRIHFTFVFDPTGDQYYTFNSTKTVNGQSVACVYKSMNWCRQVGFGVCRKYASTAQLCGFRLVRGRLWSCETYDDLLDQLAAERQRLTAIETTLSGLGLASGESF